MHDHVTYNFFVLTCLPASTTVSLSSRASSGDSLPVLPVLTNSSIAASSAAKRSRSCVSFDLADCEDEGGDGVSETVVACVLIC